jgi:hypothetical protein
VRCHGTRWSSRHERLPDMFARLGFLMLTTTTLLAADLIPTSPVEQQAIFSALAAKTYIAKQAVDDAGNVVWVCFNQMNGFKESNPAAQRIGRRSPSPWARNSRPAMPISSASVRPARTCRSTHPISNHSEPCPIRSGTGNSARDEESPLMNISW